MMDFDAYNQFFDDAIEEINEMKSQLSLVQREIRFTKCNPFRINPSSGSSCQILAELVIEGADLTDFQTAVDQWIVNLAARFVPPGTTDVG